MKKTILLITVLFICFSCKKKYKKSDFLGNWSSTSDTNFDFEIQFFNDSTVIYNPVFINSYSTKSQIEGEKIKQTLLRNNGHLEKEKSILDFKFNATYDTLWIKNETDSVYHIKLRKIESNYDFFENRIGLNLNLPQTKDVLIGLGKKDCVFPIYLGKQHDSLILTTDKSQHNLKRLKHKVISYYYRSIKENEKDSLKFALFIDESVNNKELDSVKNILRKLPIKKFFRIYNSEDYIKDDWKAEIKWLGRYED